MKYKPPTLRYSLDGGKTWNDTGIDPNTIAQHAIALSPDQDPQLVRLNMMIGSAIVYEDGAPKELVINGGEVFVVNWEFHYRLYFFMSGKWGEVSQYAELDQIKRVIATMQGIARQRGDIPPCWAIEKLSATTDAKQSSEVVK